MESQPNVGVENEIGPPIGLCSTDNAIGDNQFGNEHQTNHNGETISQPYEFIPEAPKELKPIVGMVFISENVAYDFYNEYARWCGFSIRKGSTQNSMKTGETIMRSFICSKEGYRHRKYIEATDHKKRPRAMTRCDCKAKIIVRKNESDKWEVKTFVEAHSHNLISPSKVHCLRSHRHFTDSHKVIMDKMRKAGIGPAKVLNFFTNEAGGREKMGFIDEDAKNALKIQRRDKHGKSAQELLLYFQNKHRNDNNFTYAIQLDNECRLASCFWADNISKIDYEAFGDVVCFDTTYKTNEFDMPFGPFVGVNHHKQSILFGAGLMFGETIEDFKWLFQAWLQAMGGKPPKAIITDQDPAIAAAIASVFPNTEHRLCMWHIVQKLPEKLGNVINENPSFNIDWRNCVYMCDEKAEFDALWSKMIANYNLQENKWLQDLYMIRKMWIPAYVKNTFYAGMSTTQRSESMNAFFDYFVGHRSTLLEFAEGYDRALQKRRHNELKADCDTLYSTPVAITSIDIETEMAKIYTREIFYDFQVEVKESGSLVNKLVEREGPLSKYNIFDYRRNDKMYTIIWNHDEQFGSCTCQSFEFRGIICRHLLVVFKEQSIIKMPSHYILTRWTRNAKETYRSDSTPLSSNVDESTILGRNEISCMMNYLINEGTRTPEIMEPMLSALRDLVANVRQKCRVEEETGIGKNVEGGESNIFVNAHSKNSYIVLDPMVVSTKGRTSKRFKSGREEKSKLCRGCNKWVIGHDKRNCPMYNQLDDASEEASFCTNVERGKGKAVGRPRGKIIGQGRGRMFNQD